MEALNRIGLLFLFMSQTIFLHSQTDAAMQKAFSDSYTAEYKLNYASAVSSLKAIYKEDSYECNLRLGWLYYCLKDYTTSVTYYRRAIKLKPYAVEAKFGIIKPLNVLESYDQVKEVYEDILKTDPQNTTANYWVSVIYYNRKQYDQAIRHLEKVVNLYPFDYESNVLLGWSYLSMGRGNDARVVFQKVLLIKPGDSSASEGLGRIK
jgi:tetratricopeptide (TPR) repeat protein